MIGVHNTHSYKCRWELNFQISHSTECMKMRDIFYSFRSVTFVIMSNYDWLTLPIVILIYYGSQKPKLYITSEMKTDKRHSLPLMIPLLLMLLSQLTFRYHASSV